MAKPPKKRKKRRGDYNPPKPPIPKNPGLKKKKIPRRKK